MGEILQVFGKRVRSLRRAKDMTQEQLAERAVRSATLDSGEAGKRALAWLELLDAERADLDDARREMVSWILKLRALPGMENDRPGKSTARPGLR